MAGVANFDDLRAEMSARYADLSRQLQKIARFALANPNDMALETVAAIARQADVQPSSLIRFAKAFGYDGFSDMQRVFRSRLVDRVPTYPERLRGLAGAESARTPAELLGHFVDAGVHALEHLREEVRPESLERAVALLTAADTIHIVGQRRAYPVAAYLAYALSHLDRRMHLIDGVGGMIRQQARAVDRSDALIAISFRPYSPETAAVVQRAAEVGAPIVAITDGPLSPLAVPATVAFEIEDAEVQGFRSLSAIMCLALALVVGLGQQVARAEQRRRGRGEAKRPTVAGAAG